MNIESVWQNCPFCKGRKWQHQNYQQTPNSQRRALQCRGRARKSYNLQNRLTGTPLPIFVLYYTMQGKTVALCLYGVMWPHDPFQNLNICRSLTTLTVFILCKNYVYSSTVSLDVLVDVKKSNMIEESLSRGALLPGFQSRCGTERSLSCCSWGRNTQGEAQLFEVFSEKYLGVGCIQQQLMLTYIAQDKISLHF